MHCSEEEISSSINHIILSCEQLIGQAQKLKSSCRGVPCEWCEAYLALHRIMDCSSQLDLEIGELVLLLQ